MTDELKTLKDIEDYFHITGSNKEEISGKFKAVLIDDLKEIAIKRCRMIKEIFLDGFKDKESAKTPREAYFHQLGKFEELKRICNIKEEELKNATL